MNELEPRYEVTRQDLVKDKALKIGAWSLPVLLSLIPAVVFFVLYLVSTATPMMATFLFLSLISLVVDFVFGLIVTGGILFYRSR